MLSLHTTPANVVPIGPGVLCPSRTHLAFHVKSIFTSQTRWPVTLCQPAGAFCPSSNTSKAMLTLYISFISASLHMVFLLVLSSSIACSMLVGFSTPHVCVVFLMKCLINTMMVLHFFQDVWSPPCECRFVINPSCLSKLCSLNWMGFF